jgi:Arylsulfotransferase (ASST)
MGVPGNRLLRPVVALGVLACTACTGATVHDPVAAPASPTQHFHSRPDLRPPHVQVLTPARGTAPGYLFIAPKREVEQAGPLILDDAGQVVWFHPLDTDGVTDFRVQRYQGRPVLTWWRGESARNVGNSRYVIVDDSYRVIANVSAANGLTGDIHEFLITPRNTALLTVYRRVPYDLSRLGGPMFGRVAEGIVQEVDIATGRLLFEWHSLDHVAVDESYEPVPDRGLTYDYFHINAIDVDTDGDLLVSARNTHAVYKVRRSDGAIRWRLGGKRSDFTLGPGASFAWQHDIRRQPDGTLTLFDNDAVHPRPYGHSRVLVLRLDPSRHAATLVRSYTRPKRLLSTSEGNGQFLPNGHVVVGWGRRPYVTEFDRTGRVLLDFRFSSGRADSYRAYRLPWTGHPSSRPALAVDVDRKGATVYASWNGSTELAGWRVLAGHDPKHLERVAEVRRDGFETSIRVASRAGVFEVAALAEDGRILRRSRPVVAREPAQRRKLSSVR